MTDDKELRETIRAAFACYDQDSSGWIDTAELRHLVADLGGVLTERDFRKALHVLDRDDNGVIDRDEFTVWWVSQTGNGEASGEVEKTLARLKDIGRQRFRVDIHTACWNGFEDVVVRLVEDGIELINAKDSSEYEPELSPTLRSIPRPRFDMQYPSQPRRECQQYERVWVHPDIFAAQQGNLDVVKLLLQNGAELRFAEDKHGLTPVDVCTTPAIMEVFRNLSGKPPSTPPAPTLDILSDTELKVAWTPPRPNLDEVVPVSGYKIKLSSLSAPQKIVLAVAFPTAISISGLCPDCEYVATICAINLHGMSEFSSESQPAKTKRAKPVAPTLCVTDIGPNEVTVMWALAENDRLPSTSCVIYLSSPEPDGSCRWESIFKTDDHSITSTTITKLVPDHRYKLRSAAISDDGQQTFSEAIALRTAEKPKTKRSAPRKFVSAVNAMKLIAASRKEDEGCKEEEEN